MSLSGICWLPTSAHRFTGAGATAECSRPNAGPGMGGGKALGRACPPLGRELDNMEGLSLAFDRAGVLCSREQAHTRAAALRFSVQVPAGRAEAAREDLAGKA